MKNHRPQNKSLRLSLPEDSEELNSLHCFVRAELLELFKEGDEEESSSSSSCRKAQMQDKAKKKKSTDAGRVGLRCVFCGRLPRRSRTGITMSTFFPKSVNDIYRSVCTWQRVHFRSCRHIPDDVRQKYWQLKASDRTRGKTRYWVRSARQLGLEDIDTNRGGVYLKSEKETTNC
mmetsp:Transcript_30052/g.69327  ORF Transcript_30052/g.69327 Transcript_30052/m.69327 type:complete len:175 (-) Transcript_30052:263-787(-)